MRFGLTEALLIAAGAVAGAWLRFATHLWLDQPDQKLPWATLAVNLVGSLAIGWLYGTGWIGSDERVRLLVATGFLGSLTTYSTFSLDIVRGWEAGHWGWVIGYVLLSVLGGIAAVLGGVALGHWTLQIESSGR